LVYNLRINPGKSFDKVFTSLERPSYQIVEMEKEWGTAVTFGGIEWRVSINS
jgi:hypothetical protein